MSRKAEMDEVWCAWIPDDGWPCRACVGTALAPGEMVKLVSAFRPEPLIEAMRNAGLGVYSHEVSPGKHATYFCRQSAGAEEAQRIAGVSCGEGSCP